MITFTVDSFLSVMFVYCRFQKINNLIIIHYTKLLSVFVETHNRLRLALLVQNIITLRLYQHDILPNNINKSNHIMKIYSCVSELLEFRYYQALLFISFWILMILCLFYVKIFFLYAVT